MTLNNFQIRFREELNELLSKYGYSEINEGYREETIILTNEEISTLKIRVLDTDLIIWVYDYELGIQGEGIDCIFEWQDYKNEEELIEDFIRRLEKHLISRVGQLSC